VFCNNEIIGKAPHCFGENPLFEEIGYYLGKKGSSNKKTNADFMLQTGAGYQQAVTMRSKLEQPIN
jgi:hypothetical protein